MAKHEFLTNLRVARQLYGNPRVQTDSPQLDQDYLTRKLASAAIWLTPGSVRGFDAGDFKELGPEKQRELDAAVQEFLKVAAEVPPTEPATPEQYTKAKVPFERVQEILDYYLPTSEERAKIREAIRTVEFPEWVQNWKCELDNDSSGAPSVLVTIYVDEKTAPRDRITIGRMSMELTERIRQALAARHIDRSAYVKMWTGSEFKSR